MLKFNSRYFALALLILVVEILIAIYVHDSFIRPYIGDLLVVIFIYCFLKSFVSLSTSNAALYVLLFSYFVEALQYFRIVQHLGFQRNNLARIIIGTSFDWKDILMYTIGIVTVVIIESVFSSENNM
ncbi:MAG TPA: DUF2809 domain-containing protein [Saprospiraceae bacterium]|jgi:hypothetical protein|nr:DUF2809 domain-containing protein [Saprospiraceae bacterium]MBK9995074.1 DUF2809 domain-containing protein [Saprospiraceae bacterium]HOJ90442.1 DUF2809 domain-containing protein [Saprospiraceae bacterium]HUN15325.1 DUF2809 domain-containing protein [Saprospiraceae bacterium]